MKTRKKKPPIMLKRQISRQTSNRPPSLFFPWIKMALFSVLLGTIACTTMHNIGAKSILSDSEFAYQRSDLAPTGPWQAIRTRLRRSSAYLKPFREKLSDLARVMFGAQLSRLKRQTPCLTGIGAANCAEAKDTLENQASGFMLSGKNDSESARMKFRLPGFAMGMTEDKISESNSTLFRPASIDEEEARDTNEEKEKEEETANRYKNI